MRIIFFVISLFFIINVKVFSMFVVGKQTSEGFLPLGEEVDIQSLVYKTLMTYQYPMSLVLPDGDYGTLFESVENGEQDFLRKKLQEISPDLDIAYISTTLWEFYALYVMARELDELAIKGDKDALKDKLLFVYSIKKDKNLTRQDIIEAYKKPNFIPEIKRLYLAVNDYILSDICSSSRENFEKELQVKSISIGRSLIESLMAHIKFASKFNFYNEEDFASEAPGRLNLACVFKDFPKDRFEEFSAASTRNLNGISLFDNLIQSEIFPSKTDQIWLYRGTALRKSQNQYRLGMGAQDSEECRVLIDSVWGYRLSDAEDKIYESYQHTLSYGGSVFAGIIYDPGACAFAYLKDCREDSSAVVSCKPNYFYRIALNKNEIRQHNDSSNFVIYPVNQLVHFFIGGSGWHPWTKKVNDLSFGHWFQGNLDVYAQNRDGDYAIMTIKAGSFLELARDISNLLSESELLGFGFNAPSQQDQELWSKLKLHQVIYSKFLEELIKNQ